MKGIKKRRKNKTKQKKNLPQHLTLDMGQGEGGSNLALFLGSQHRNKTCQRKTWPQFSHL